MNEFKLSDEEVQFVRNKFNLNQEHTDVFIRQCERYNLNPIANQIYPQVRQGRLNITTGIDGYRLVADRTGKYAGNDDPVYDNEDSPRTASVTVYKIVAGTRCAFTASARWDQYFPGEKQGFMWKKMPHLMLGKCAEALALRKAFPAELSGIYTQEEMEQAGAPDPVEPPRAQRPVPAEQPVDDEADMHKRNLVSIVQKWTGQQDVMDLWVEYLQHMETPIDGTAPAGQIALAVSFAENCISEGKSFDTVVRNSGQEVQTETKVEEEVPW